MVKNLTDVFKLCIQHKLKLHPEKCTSLIKKVTYLGHDVIKNYPKPANADEARRFVAFYNHYRRLNQNVIEKSRHAFKYIKRELMKPILLQYPDFSKEFCIQVNKPSSSHSLSN